MHREPPGKTGSFYFKSVTRSARVLSSELQCVSAQPEQDLRTAVLRRGILRRDGAKRPSAEGFPASCSESARRRCRRRIVTREVGRKRVEIGIADLGLAELRHERHALPDDSFDEVRHEV